MKLRLIILMAAISLLTTSFLYNGKEQSTICSTNLLSLTKYKDSTLMWNLDRKLVWDDFLGKGDKRSGYAALTSSKIGFDAEWFEDSVIIVIPTYFDHLKSWVLVKTDDLLAHEQGHFDITEIVARMIRMELSQQKFTSISVTSKKINAIYSKHANGTWNSYDKYDRETKHGVVKKKQEEWLEYIASELSSLDRYSSDTVVIRRL